MRFRGSPELPSGLEMSSLFGFGIYSSWIGLGVWFPLLGSLVRCWSLWCRVASAGLGWRLGVGFAPYFRCVGFGDSRRLPAMDLASSPKIKMILAATDI